MNKLFFTFSLLFFAIAAISQDKTRTYFVDPQWAPREHNVDFLHMKLELSFVPESGLVKGKVTHTFAPLMPTVDSIFLDAPDIIIKNVLINNKPSAFKVYKEGVAVYSSTPLIWGTKDSMVINYEAYPKKGLYFIGWNDPQGICRKQIWSQGQGIDNRHWIPMYDEMNDKLTTEMIVSFNKEYKVLSNGTQLPTKENKDGTRTWHYKMKNPHAPYLVMLGIGIYDIKQTKSKGGVPMNLYYYPDWVNRVDATYKYSEEIMDFFESEIGVKYAWESYSQIPVQEFMYGAMENTTATVFGDFLFVDERSYNDRFYVGVNAHELAHQWFGDLITARSDAHHWLQESFATYYDWLFEKYKFGDDVFDNFRRSAQNSAIDELKKNLYPVAHSESGSTRHYPQGAMVLNMLKYVSGGREAYNKAIKYYLEKYKYQNVDSDNLLYAFHETLGLSLNWFWEQWIYKNGIPKYQITYSQQKSYTEIVVVQNQELSNLIGGHEHGSGASNSVTQDPFVQEKKSDYSPAGLFKMPIWFEVYYKDGTSEKKMQWIAKQTEVVQLPNTASKEIDYILFDPNNMVMKQVDFVKPFAMYQSQAVKATYMLDRLDAVIAMRDVPFEVKRTTLINVFNKENFNAIKTEIISQLADDNNQTTIALFKSALKDKDPLVRKSVLQNVRTIPSDMLTDIENMLSDPSYEIVALTLDVLNSANPSKMKTYLDVTKGVVGTSGRNVEIKWLEYSFALTGDKQYTDKLVTYTSVSYEFRTRVNAAQALKRLDYFDEQFMKNLVNTLYNANSRLANPCGDVLKSYFEKSKYQKIIRSYIYGQKWETWKWDKISKVVM